MKWTIRLIAVGGVLLVPLLVVRATLEEGQDVPLEAAAARCTLESGPHAITNRIRETSGIARTADGSLWTHNDGSEAVLYRLDEAGALRQTVSLEGAHALDIEDIDAAPCPDGSGECLWLADTGDNDRERPEVALLLVSVPAADVSSTRARRVPFDYPGGSRDVESIAVLPSGDVVLVTKGRGAPVDVFRVRAAGPAGAGTAQALVRLADMPDASRDRMTGAGASEDGEWIALRTNDALSVHRADALLAGTVAPVLTHDLRPLRESQGEGVDIAADGRIWLTSEGERGTPTLARLRCSLPDALP